MHKNHLLAATIFCMTAVAFGALGAHYVKKIITPDQLTSYETAVRFQFFHGLTILIVAILNERIQLKNYKHIQQLFIAGTCLFCISIYILLFTSFKFIGPITPIGGILLLVAWILLLLSTLKYNNHKI